VVDLIDQFIDSPVLSHNLKIIAHTLSQDNNITFFTDRSLQRDSLHIDAIDIGWVVINYDDIEFTASSVLWPSSTKAEMLACFTALLVTLINAMVTIQTDSATTILDFDKIADLMHLSVRKREKIPYFQLWMTIAYIISMKNLKLIIVKVKVHSGN